MKPGLPFTPLEPADPAEPGGPFVIEAIEKSQSHSNKKTWWPSSEITFPVLSAMLGRH
jgi:hypothetical protein